MKILYILNIASKVNNFSYTSMIASKELGYDFHIAGNWEYSYEDRIKDEMKYGIHIHQIDMKRNPFSLQNIKAYKQLVNLVKSEKFDIIHCNTPIGGFLGRLIGKKCKVKKVIYQVHGFHFYKGAGFLKWFLFYPIERWLAKKTDAIITINFEDYQIAKSLKLRPNGSVYYVNGVGVNTSIDENYENFRLVKRKSLGLSDSDIMILSVGEINKNKNIGIVIDSLFHIGRNDIYYFLCGEGKERSRLERKARNSQYQDNFRFLGYCSNVNEMYCAADIFILSSKREGLSRSLMEAMTYSLPCIVSNIRGNVDLIQENQGGFLCMPDNKEDFSKAIVTLANDVELRNIMGLYNKSKIKSFDIKIIINEIKSVYEKVINS